MLLAKATTDKTVEATSSGTSVSELLSTPEPFDINAIADVTQDIERLETLAADHHSLNSNSRFLTRFGRLTSQREKLETRFGNSLLGRRDITITGNAVYSIWYGDPSDMSPYESMAIAYCI
jgi:hypothetical protein